MTAALLLDEYEAGYQVAARMPAENGRPPRRYSPRFDKKRSGGHDGAHRRGSRRAVLAR